jgi:uncharacterized protein (DUF1501 family)
MKRTITRRDFVARAGLVGAGLAVGPKLFFRSAEAAEGKGPVFVHLFQRGGMDGLSAVVPYADPDYRKLRKNTAIPSPKKGDATRAIRLDDRFGLHPALGALRGDYAEKRLAIVHAVGSTDPTRSHFDAQDFMETGTPGVKGTANGWINRYLARNAEDAKETFRAVATTAVLPRVMKGDARALAIQSFQTFRMGGGDFMSDAFGGMYGADGDDVVHQSGREALAAIARLKRVNPAKFQPENGAQYPRGRVGQQMLMIAQLIKSGLGLEVAFAECGGWDTHLNQGAATGSLANRLKEVGDALHAFSLDLRDRMENVVVATLTEFGRTAKENGTNGTDHGHGSCCFVLGGPVKGGKVYGRWPGLSAGRLWQKRDLAVTTDFRDVLAEVLGKHMGTKDLSKVFPKHKAKKVGLI